MRVRRLLARLLGRNLDREAAARAVAAYRDVFATDDGEAILLDLAVYADLYESTRPKDRDDALYRAGQRSVVMRILSMVEDKQISKRLGDPHE